MQGARVLIAGAGYVGGRLAERLAREGAEVFALRRNAKALPSGLNAIVADLFQPAELSLLPRNLDFVVYAVSPDRHDEAAYQRAYCDGLQNLLAAEALALARSPRIVLTSSTAVYGQKDGSWVDETSDTVPTSFAGKKLLEAEALLRSSGRPHVVLRLAGIYGPGRDRMVRQALAGEARYPSEPTFTNRIHREDCAGAILHLLKLSEPETLYLGVDHEPAELEAVQTFICRATGSPPPSPGDASRRSRGSNKRCSSLRLRKSGYQFVFPTYREGYADLIASSLT